MTTISATLSPASAPASAPVSPSRANPLRRVIRRVSHAITRAHLERCIHRVCVDLTVTNETLKFCEESRRINGPFAHPGLAAQIAELERKLDGLEGELAHLEYHRHALEEKCECP